MSVDYEEDYWHHSNWEDVRCGTCDFLFGTAPVGTHKSMTCEGCEEAEIAAEFADILDKHEYLADLKVCSYEIGRVLMEHLKTTKGLLQTLGIEKESEADPG